VVLELAVTEINPFCLPLLAAQALAPMVLLAATVNLLSYSVTVGRVLLNYKPLFSLQNYLLIATVRLPVEGALALMYKNSSALRAVL
jgi:hypothetical protein